MERSLPEVVTPPPHDLGTPHGPVDGYTKIPNEYNNYFILNHILDFHTTSLFKLCDDMFESLTKLFVDKMIKKG